MRPIGRNEGSEMHNEFFSCAWRPNWLRMTIKLIAHDDQIDCAWRRSDWLRMTIKLIAHDFTSENVSAVSCWLRGNSSSVLWHLLDDAIVSAKAMQVWQYVCALLGAPLATRRHRQMFGASHLTALWLRPLRESLLSVEKWAASAATGNLTVAYFQQTTKNVREKGKLKLRRIR